MEKLTQTDENDLWDVEVLLHAELIASAFKKKEIDLYVLWSILKAIDYHKIGANGLVHYNTIMDKGMRFLNIKKRQMYQKFKEGIGIYWTKPGGKRNAMKCILLSRDHVVRHLQPEAIQSRSFLVMIENLVAGEDEGITHIKSYALCLFASRLGLSRPYSQVSIAHSTGLSLSTVKRLLSHNTSLIKRNNINIVFETSDLAEALQKRKEQKDSFRYQVLFIGNQWCVCQILPKSYDMPVKTSSNKIDSSLLLPQSLEDRRYFEKNDKPQTIQNTFILNETTLKDESVWNVWSKNH